MSRISYSCFAWREDDTWEAVCVDLDISVQGRSFDEVYRCLNEAVLDYVETVSELPEEERAHLLNRRVPFWTRVRIQAGFWRAALGRRGDGGDHGSFPVSAVLA